MSMVAAVNAGKMPINLAIAYGASKSVSSDISTFYSSHVDSLKKSDNELIERTGRVLESTAVGYGIGYIAPVAIIAAGQLILGNPLQAVTQVGSALIFSNPMAATCAAMGALYYGYQALNAQEREEFLTTLESGLALGRELVKSIIGFAERKLTEFLNSDSLRELKKFVTEYATMCGRSLADITNAVSDRVVLAAHKASLAATDAAQSVGSSIYTTAVNAGEFAGSAASQAQTRSSDAMEWIGETAGQFTDRLRSLTFGDKDNED